MSKLIAEGNILRGAIITGAILYLDVLRTFENRVEVNSIALYDGSKPRIIEYEERMFYFGWVYNSNIIDWHLIEHCLN